MLSKCRRAALVTAERRFHSANVRNGPPGLPMGTRVVAMNLSGKITTNEVLLTHSGRGASSPTWA